MSTPSENVTTRAGHGRLLKILGVGFGLAVSIGNTIAAGIVRTPGEIAQYLPEPWLFFSVWLVGGLYALLGSVVIAELGTMIPQSGGQYVFAHRALGPYAGFIVGWSDWISTCGTNAAVSIAIGEYTSELLTRVMPLEAGLIPATTVLTATVTVLAFAALNWRGIRGGSAAQEFTSLLKALIFLGIVVACFLFGHRAEVTQEAAPAGIASLGLFTAYVMALQAVMYTYDGWTGPIYFSEEVRDGEKNIPRAMFGGALAIVGIYALFNLAVLYILPLSKLVGEKFAIGAAASAVFGPGAGTAALVLMVICLLSGINAYVLMTSRVLFAMGRDGLFAARACHVNAGGTPTFSLFLSTAVALSFLLTGTFNQVINICAFFFVANYTISFASIFVLRWREPQTPRPYRAWGHPWTTGLVLLGSVAYLSGVILSDPKTSRISLLLLGLSYPIYRFSRRLAKGAAKPKV